jgi:hypothetical protein
VLRIRDGQRLQHHLLDQSEHGRRRADAERQGEHGRRGKRRRPSHFAERVAQVLEQGFEPDRHDGVPRRLADV